MKKIDLYPFTPCKYPIHIHNSKMDTFVPCGRCYVCRQNKGKVYSQQLSLEENHYKYCYFVTLTYNEQSVPRYQYIHVLNDESNKVEVNFQPLFKRYHKRYHTELPIETLADSVPFGTSFEDLDKSYKRYVFQRHLYEINYSRTHFHHQDGTIDLLYPQDLKLFLYGFKNLLRTKYNTTFRYFAVGEYGTQSLRPHWHLLLFFNSSDLARDMEICDNNGTQSRPSQVARIVRPLWQYGIAETVRTDKSASSYITKYVNRPSNFPKVLEWLSAPKSYHSSHLGQILPKEVIKENFLNRNFEYFDAIPSFNSQGDCFTYALWRSCYASYFPKPSFVDGYRIMDISALFREALRNVQSVERLNSDYTTYQVAKVLFTSIRKNPELHSGLFRTLFAQQCQAKYIFQLNTFRHLIYWVHHVQKNVLFFFGSLSYFAVDSYFKLFQDVYSYLDLRTLKTHYTECNNNQVYQQFYYKYLNMQDIRDRNNDPLMQAYLKMQYRSFALAIKHRDISDRYKNISNE